MLKSTKRTVVSSKGNVLAGFSLLFLLNLQATPSPTSSVHKRSSTSFSVSISHIRNSANSSSQKTLSAKRAPSNVRGDREVMPKVSPYTPLPGIATPPPFHFNKPSRVVLPFPFPDVKGALAPTVTAAFVHAISAFRIAEPTSFTHKTSP